MAVEDLPPVPLRPQKEVDRGDPVCQKNDAGDACVHLALGRSPRPGTHIHRRRHHHRLRHIQCLYRGRHVSGDETSFYPFAYPKKMRLKRGK